MPAATVAPLRTAIGLMSGTSMDGVDAALIRSDGRGRVEFGARLTRAYDPALRASLRGALGKLTAPAGLIESLTRFHADAVQSVLDQSGSTAADIDVIGFHGHTICHRPWERETVQIGDGALLARLTGIDVVNDFRRADVKAGGQGAPFVPVFHAALARGLAHPVAVLNVGGVANVTWIGADFDPAAAAPDDSALLAFDTGPGNALLDDWVFKHTGAHWDGDGRLARAGTADVAAAAAILADPYFDRAPPKSLDRDHFDASPVGGLSPADGAATLVEVTARSAAAAARFFPAPAKRWLVCGGGRRNPAIMQALRNAIAAPVDPVEAVGWDGDALEAQAFAYLALRSLDGLPLSFPRTTGVPRALTGGCLTRP
ncbi:MAG: anhydro-N-acetylmuramic acid kinase [Rhodospirillaceae bacterium]|nr:anhydro-N-acetylmuramic acid kinase [Rhodospirillaceae bacterium]